MKFARNFLGLFFTALLLVTLGCQGKKQVEKKRRVSPRQEIRINILSEPQVLDPRRVRSLGDINLARTFMEGLLRVSETDNAAPAVAEKYTLDENKKTYTFYLRDSLWSNGEPVTAHDFIYAWKKTLSPEFPSDYAFLMYSIKNAKAIKSGNLPLSMLGVYAKDDHTLVIELENPTPYFPELLSLPTFFPVNANVDRETPDWHRNARTYVSNGPFLPSEWKHNDMIVAVKNPNYWDTASVRLERIDMVMVDAETGFKMYQNNELDWEGSPYSTIPADAIASLKEQNLIKADPLLGTYWIRVNTALFPFHSEEFRRALSLSINREEIVTHVTGSGLAATSIVPASLGLSKEPLFTDGDIDEALSHFQVAMERQSLKKENFPEITLTYSNTDRNRRVAQALQDQWQKTLHIKVRLEALESKIFFDRMSKGDYQLAIGSWTADYRDPLNFLEVFKSKTVGTNNTSWENLDYQKAIEASYLATSQEERSRFLQTAEKIITEESPVIPIFQFTMLHVQNNNLKNVLLTDSGHIDFRWAYVDE